MYSPYEIRDLTCVESGVKQRKNGCSGFTLIELMVVIAVMALLVALAMPSYKNYVMRAKITEGLSILGSKKSEVSTHYLSSSKMPRYIEDIGWASKNTPSLGRWNTYKGVFGSKNAIWDRVGLVGSNRKGKNQYVDLYMRTKRLKELNNKRGFMYLQAKASGSDNGVEFQCSVSRKEMMPLVPVSCAKLRGKFARW